MHGLQGDIWLHTVMKKRKCHIEAYWRDSDHQKQYVTSHIHILQNREGYPCVAAAQMKVKAYTSEIIRLHKTHLCAMGRGLSFLNVKLVLCITLSVTTRWSFFQLYLLYFCVSRLYVFILLVLSLSYVCITYYFSVERSYEDITLFTDAWLCWDAVLFKDAIFSKTLQQGRFSINSLLIETISSWSNKAWAASTSAPLWL